MLGLEGLLGVGDPLLAGLDRLLFAGEGLHLGFEAVFAFDEGPFAFAELVAGLGGLLFEGFPGLDGRFFGFNHRLFDDARRLFAGLLEGHLGRVGLGLAHFAGQEVRGGVSAPAHTSPTATTTKTITGSLMPNIMFLLAFQGSRPSREETVSAEESRGAHRP